MMISKRKIAGIVALALVFGVFAACSNGTTSISPTKFTITDLGAHNGKTVIVGFFNSANFDAEITAIGVGTIWGGTLTVDLLDTKTYYPWKKGGSFYLLIIISDNSGDKNFVYTDGEPYVQLDLTPKFNSANSSTSFSKFKEV